MITMAINDLLKNIKPESTVEKGPGYEIYSSIIVEEGVINISAAIKYYRTGEEFPSKIMFYPMRNSRILKPGRIIPDYER